jgi:hypothetical protein
MEETIPSYSDSLVTINDNGILFKYYGLLGGDRFVQFNDIEKIVIKKPTIWSGKWRWHGSGDFMTWFPADYARQSRDVIFVVYIRNKWWRVGFTVEDSSMVVSILQEKGFIDSIHDISLATSKLDGQAIVELRAKNKQMKSIFWIVIILSGVILPLFLILYFAFFN